MNDGYTPKPMPVTFFGHGNPMNTLQDNVHTRAWAQFGKSVPRPKGIVCVSAHWYTRGTAVTAMENPRTIHDFGGFPKALHEVQYDAPGDPALAERVAMLLAPADVARDERSWGLDHGAWSVLKHVYPDADIPVVQLSLDGLQPAPYHYELAKKLAPLRDEGILVMGSGNVVHNLETAVWSANAAPYEWATRFNDTVRARLLAGDCAFLTDPEKMGEDAELSIPTPEHYLPLLYVAALRRAGDEAVFLTDGIDLGSISMMSVAYMPR